MKKFNLIFLNTGKLLLSSKEYKSWWEIQSEYENYSASLDFESLGDIMEYISTDYKLERSFVEDLISKFVESKVVTMELKF
jgi:hypothetical protein